MSLRSLLPLLGLFFALCCQLGCDDTASSEEEIINLDDMLDQAQDQSIQDQLDDTQTQDTQNDTLDAIADLQPDLSPDSSSDAVVDLTVDGELDISDCESLGPDCCSNSCPCEDDRYCIGASPTEAGRCLTLPPNRCYTEAHCDPGQECYFAQYCGCDEDCDPSPGRCDMECCSMNPDDCPAGSQCIERERDGVKTCAADLSPGECWLDSDCPSGECLEAQLCSCLENCVSFPGRCSEPTNCDDLPADCCNSDCPCSAEQVCLDGGDQDGRCVNSDLPAFSCWTSDDCDQGYECYGASVCPCGDNCALPDTPGQCLALASSCCDEGDPNGCPLGSDCLPIDGQGTCHAQLPSPSCWLDEDCAADEVCQGAQLCHCMEWCLSSPGICQPAPACDDYPNNCCSSQCPCQNSNADCVPSQGGEYEGVCKQRPGNNRCWSDAHCSTPEVCANPVICPCDMLCADESPGQCSMPSGSCCDPNAPDACPEYMSCRSDTGSAPTCHVIPAPGSCWTDADCADQKQCQGAFLCGCDVFCLSQLGTCE